MSCPYESLRSRILLTLGAETSIGSERSVRGPSPRESDDAESSGRESGVFRPFRPFPAVGRSFVVASRPRRASLEQRADWLTDIGEVRLRGLGDFERRLLSAHWANFALAEHAGVAGLARLEQQLRSQGAPTELVSAAGRAIHTETHHARLGFSLASAYGEVEVGPGEFSLAGALDDLSLPHIVETIVREGCIAFSEAALEAGAAGELSSDPVVRELLLDIEDDERAHAELAFRALLWLFEKSPEVEEFVEEAFEGAAFAGWLEALAENDSFALPRSVAKLGVLTAEERGLIRRRVRAEIIEPCARRFIAGRTRRSRSGMTS
jgi:hypothetical protein